MTSPLFQPIQLAGLTLPNRIVIAPMCQYSADDGDAADWHLIHLGHLALSGAGLLILEATAVERSGRITPGDLGLYSDANERALGAGAGCRAATTPPCRSGCNSAMPGANPPAGRLGTVASRSRWRRAAGLATLPPPCRCKAGETPPAALDRTGLARVRDAFVQAAQRAVRLGLQLIELHGAHGYLLHQFLSPIANQRNDDYGGPLENRMRFPLEVLRGGAGGRAGQPPRRRPRVRDRLGRAWVGAGADRRSSPRR